MQRPSLLKILAYGALGFAGYRILGRNPRLLKLAAGYVGGYIGQNFLAKNDSMAQSAKQGFAPRSGKNARPDRQDQRGMDSFPASDSPSTY